MRAMKKLLFISALLLLVLVSCGEQKGEYVQISGYAQGNSYTVKMNMKGVPCSVETVRDSIDALIVQIDTTLSGYNKKSLLSRFNAGEKIPSTQMFWCRGSLRRLGLRLQKQYFPDG